MAVHASHAALPYPVKGARFTVPVVYLDADGDPLDPTTPDTEISMDGAAFADCAEEVTTITGGNGSGFITLSGAETDCSFVVLAAKVASGPKNTLMMLYPRVLPVAYSGTATAGAAGSITLATDVPAVANLLLGCIVKTTGGTGGGGTGGTDNQARVITAFSAGRVATVVPDWETTPDATTTYQILLTDGKHVEDTNVYHADIQFTRDQSNTTDEWTATWFKNGVRLTSGVTSPTLQLVKRADGTDLKVATAMTEIGTTESFKLDLVGAERLTVGEPVIAIAAATIDSGSRSFARLVGRDSV